MTPPRSSARERGELEHAWNGDGDGGSGVGGASTSSLDEFLQPLRADAAVGRPKKFVFVRHGHSTWNEQSRIQGNTNESELTPAGRAQAARARDALLGIPFDSCFSSPHTRARQTAEIVWAPFFSAAPGAAAGAAAPAGAAAAAAGAAAAASSSSSGPPPKPPPPLYLESLCEADLGWFQGLRNEDIARDHPGLYRVWREAPERFALDGRLPVLEAFRQARRAWHDMLAAPGQVHLVITHKSLLRALLCTALGLPPRQFRAIDVSNGAVCMVRSTARGDVMLSALNLTSHLLHDGVRYAAPGLPKNDALAAASGDGAGAVGAGAAGGEGAAEASSDGGGGGGGGVLTPAGVVSASQS